MKISLYFVLIFSAWFLISCTSQPKPPLPVIQAENYNRIPGTNESLLTIQRTNNPGGDNIITYVYVNGVAKMTITNGGIGRIIIPNGIHTLNIQAVGWRIPELIKVIELNSETVVYNLDLGGNRHRLNETSRQILTKSTGIEGALSRAAGQTLINVPQRSRIAIVFITADDRSTTDYITGELEFIWVNVGYIITDRSQLDKLREEQNFQLSGEVDDATAVSIGRFAGADIIVTGRVDGEGELRRLRLRAINTQTAQVVGVASERL